MKIALVGMPQVGKKTLFSLMTGMPYDQLTSRATEYAVGMVKVTDSRVGRLSGLYKPKKTKYAEIECTLTPAPPKDTKPREQWLGKLKDMDAFCHVVRAFDDDAVFHADGSVDPLRDIEMMNLELAITDLSLVELRLDRIVQEQKKKADAASVEEAALLQTLKPYLESGKSLREHPMEEAELKKIRSLQFLTLKSTVTALNCGESNYPNPQLLKAAQTKVTGQGNESVRFPPKSSPKSRRLEIQTSVPSFYRRLESTSLPSMSSRACSTGRLATSASLLSARTKYARGRSAEAAVPSTRPAPFTATSPVALSAPK